MSSPIKVVSTDAVTLTRGIIGTALAASFLVGCVGAASFLSYMAIREPTKAVEYLNGILSLRAIPMGDTARVVVTFVNWAMLAAMACYLVIEVSRLYFASVLDRSHLARLQQEARLALRKRQLTGTQMEVGEPEKREAANS